MGNGISMFAAREYGLVFQRYQKVSEDGKPMGFLIASVNAPGRPKSHGFPKIFAMYVAPEYRGKGVSTELVDTALNNLDELNSDYILSNDSAQSYRTYLQ